jgi:23S rRNA (adenine2503-C2)-methyltransferase
MSEPNPSVGASTRPDLRRDAAGRFVDAQGRVDIKALSREALTRFVVEELGETPGRALRIYKGLWQRGARTFDELPDVAASVRRKLEDRAYILLLEPEVVLRSDDGTFKYLWRLEDGHAIESVLIPDEERLTLCMSSQVGCAMACSFCLTGDLGLKRHLKPSEIAAQPMQVGRQLEAGRRITNLVLMGMGEPLHNLDNLTEALRVCLDDHALNFSHRKVTVSTVGLVPDMAELAARLPVNLAVSVNASSEEQRRQIMPITRRYSLAELMDACRRFPLPPGKRITFEYVMFDGFNDAIEDAERLWALLQGIPTKLNLIPYNPNPDRPKLQPPPPERVKAFQHWFVERGVNCSVRTTRGQDISAACGQLGKAWQQAQSLGWLEDARRIAGLFRPVPAGANA